MSTSRKVVHWGSEHHYRAALSRKSGDITFIAWRVYGVEVKRKDILGVECWQPVCETRAYGALAQLIEEMAEKGALA
jgi:hypothetical protein